MPNDRPCCENCRWSHSGQPADYRAAYLREHGRVPCVVPEEISGDEWDALRKPNDCCRFWEREGGASYLELERAALLLVVGEEALSHPLIVLRTAAQQRARRDLDNAVRRMRDDMAPEVYAADE